MLTVEVTLDEAARSAVAFLSRVDQALPAESSQSLLQSFKICEASPSDRNRLAATAADTSLVLLKFGEEFIGRVAALGARDRQSSVIVPSAANVHRHE